MRHTVFRMSWLYALLVVCSVFAAEAMYLEDPEPTHEEIYYPRSHGKVDLWEKYRRSLQALPSGDQRAAKYLRQLNINHVCTMPDRVELCQKILQNYESGELRKVLQRSFYESSIRGRDLMEIVFESLLHSEGLNVPQAREQGQSAFWKYVFGKLPHKFIDDVVEALHHDLSSTCTPQEIHFLMSSSEDNVPSVMGHMRKHGQIFDARRANYLDKKYGEYSPYGPKKPKKSVHEYHVNLHEADGDQVGMPLPPWAR